MEPSQRSDRELVEAIQRGDPAAFETLYYCYRDWIAALAYRFSGHREDALDAMQETFAYLLKKLPGLELRCQMKTLLYPVVKHLALARKQAARRHAPLESAGDPPARETPVRDDEAMERLLGSLPEAQREVVRLRFADGLDLKEIAAALGIPLGTVKSRLHAALETLRRSRTSEDS